jgi:hypothetical protein
MRIYGKSDKAIIVFGSVYDDEASQLLQTEFSGLGLKIHNRRIITGNTVWPWVVVFVVMCEQDRTNVNSVSVVSFRFQRTVLPKSREGANVRV